MSISGHNTEASIRSYSKNDDTRKRKITKTLSDAIIGMHILNFFFELEELHVVSPVSNQYYKKIQISILMR